MFVVISVEFSTRELDAQLLLAHSLARKGVQCLVLYDQLAKVVAQEFAKRKLSYILVDKSASSACLPKRIALAKQGEKSLAYVIFQESFMNITEDPDTRILWKKYTDPRASELVDGFFMFGRRSADLLTEDFPSLGSKIYSHGNPRTDLLQENHEFFYQDDVRALKQLYGKFILVNDAHLNPDWASSPGAIDLGFPAQWSDDKAWVSQGPPATAEFHEYNKRFIGEFVPFLKDVASQSSDTFFILRPHPNNRPDMWGAAFRGAENILVQYHMPAEPWMLASKLLLTDGCTTGLQMLAAKKQVVSLDLLKRPHRHPSAISELAEIKVKNSGELIPALAAKSLPKLKDITIENLNSYISCSGDATSDIVNRVMQDAGDNGLLDQANFLDLQKFDLSNINVPAHQPWKWQAGLQCRVRQKIHLLNEEKNSNIFVKKIGWNSFAIAEG